MTVFLTPGRICARRAPAFFPLSLAVCLAATLLSAPPARAAMPVYLFLEANGTVIEGDSTVTSLGRENSIECLSFDQQIRQPIDPSTGLPSGRRIFEPIVIRKRIDKSSPLLAKALAQNEVIDAQFRFYRPNPAGDGTTQYYYTIEIHQGRISRFRTLTFDVLDPSQANYPAVEEVEFVFQQILWRYEPDGIEFGDQNDPRVASPSGLIVNGAAAAAAAPAPATEPKGKDSSSPASTSGSEPVSKE